MDSQRCIQEAGRMKGYDLNIARNKVDLTLKLGLPDTDSDQFLSHLEQCVYPVPNPMTPHHANLNLSGPYTRGINQHGMFNSSESPQGEHNFTANQIKYSQEMGSHAYNMQPNELGQFTSSLVGLPPYTNSYDNFNPNLAPTALVTMNAYTLLDPPRRVEGELRIYSSDARWRGTRRQHAGGNNDPTKKCTNYNCKTNDTPMWRKGPLGPKTLCNACGIKYRKEEEKKRPREAANSNRLNGRMKEKLQKLKY